MNLTDRHVVVIGGSRGIGAALGRAFTSAGSRVTLVARGAEQLRSTAETIGASHVVADVGAPADLIDRVARIAPVDVLVNNAGVDRTGAFGDLSAQELNDIYAVNAIAPAELSRQVLPSMVSRRTGRIVFVSSLSAQVSLPGLTAYSAAKAAVSQLAEGLRREVRGSGVRVTLAEFGAVDTGMYQAVQAYPPAAAAFRRLLSTRTLRLLTADEVAGAVVTACRADHDSVVLPRRARAQVALARMPQRIGNLLV